MISCNLLKHYITKRDEEEAIQGTETLINNNKTSSITEATASSLENEKVLKPDHIVNLLDQRADLAINRNDKAKTKQKRKADKLKNKKEKKENPL